MTRNVMSRIRSSKQLQNAIRRKPSRMSPCVRCQAQLGDKVLPMLRNTTDMVLLGPRVALGALLSTNQNLERLPADLERLSTIISDPRPMEDKQNEVLLEIEDRVALFIERGIGAENDVITAMAGIIPDDVKASMPEDLKQAVLTPRNIPSADQGYGASADSNGAGMSPSLDTRPMPTWTVSSMDESDQQFPSTPSTSGIAAAEMVYAEAPVSAATVAASQAAAELVEIQSAVLGVREQLSALQTNTDSSKTNMLKLNLREASQALNQRLQQRRGVSSNAEVAAAAAEAEALLVEVESLMG